MNLNDDVVKIKGIGPKSASYFYKLGIKTVRDLLYYFPRKYDVFSECINPCEEHEDALVSIKGKVMNEGKPIRVRNLSITNVKIITENEVMKITFFNMPYIKNVLKLNSVHIFHGYLRKNKTGYYMEQPRIFKEDEYGFMLHEMQPVYPVTTGITSNKIRAAVEQVRQSIAMVDEILPQELLDEYNIMPIHMAIEQMHFPKDFDMFAMARKRFAFVEFLQFLLSVKMMKAKMRCLNTLYPMVETGETKRVIEGLPYKLTNAQQRVWGEICDDLQGDKVVNRMVQGDVGSGKTIVAFLAMIMTASNGYQAAMMAPTEVLARQHFEQMKALIEKHHFNFKVCLLTGSTTAKDRKVILQEIENGSISIVIGTHAVFQDTVTYHKLALAITDEQHRFGVKQREQLVKKGVTTNVIVMSATPIPRSLAMILYSDMNLSAVDEMPQGRIPIKNCVVEDSYRDTAHNFILKEIAKGRQAYIICPMIEESETVDAQNVIEYYEKLKAKLPEHIRVGLLHGKMKNEEKNRIMEHFAAREIDILVSTTVIEVGINVPNATVMMVENAERFGLASLHQLRGRVGRGKEQSYCIFINGKKDKKQNERLDILLHSNDGFEIANRDLKLRGPGDITGIAQSGDIPFVLGDIYQDEEILKIADEVSERIVNDEGRVEKFQPFFMSLLQDGNNKVDFRTI